MATPKGVVETTRFNSLKGKPMKQCKPRIIPYYKYKQKAFWKFNNALAHLIHLNGGMSHPFGGRIDNTTRFEFEIYLKNGSLSQVEVRQSLVPLGFFDQVKLSNGSLGWVFINPNVTDSSKDSKLLLDQATEEALSGFLKAFCKLPTKVRKVDLSYVAITVWHDYLNYTIFQSNDMKLEFKTSID